MSCWGACLAGLNIAEFFFVTFIRLNTRINFFLRFSRIKGSLPGTTHIWVLFQEPLIYGFSFRNHSYMGSLSGTTHLWVLFQEPLIYEFSFRNAHRFNFWRSLWFIFMSDIYICFVRCGGIGLRRKMIDGNCY